MIVVNRRQNGFSNLDHRDVPRLRAHAMGATSAPGSLIERFTVSCFMTCFLLALRGMHSLFHQRKTSNAASAFVLLCTKRTSIARSC